MLQETWYQNQKEINHAKIICFNLLPLTIISWEKTTNASLLVKQLKSDRWLS